MKTIYQLQEIADRLRAVIEVDSISPEDTFGLQSDVLAYLADMEQNAEGLGIHKVYESYTAMATDGDAPIGSNGKPLRFGQLVIIYDSANVSRPENGNIYAWQKGNADSPWLLMGNISRVHALQSQIDSLLGRIAEEEATREKGDVALWDGIDTEAEARKIKDTELVGKIAAEETARKDGDTAILQRMDEALFSLDSSYEEDGVTIYGYSDKNGGVPIANADIDAATHETAGVMSAGDKVALDSFDGRLAAEAAARLEADVVLDNRIDIEAATREGGDAALQAGIDTVNRIIGTDYIPEFTETERYEEGDFVMNAGRLYRFVRPHQGEWANDALEEVTATQLSVVQEKGYDHNAIMSQAAVTRVLSEMSDKSALARFDDIVDSAEIGDGLVVTENYEVVYVKNSNVFAARLEDGTYRRWWENSGEYNDAAGTCIQKDKFFLCDNEIYLWGDAVHGLYPYKESALCEVDETDYFPDYVETQIRGYDGDGHSVTVKAATHTEAGVMSADDKATLDGILAGNQSLVDVAISSMSWTVYKNDGVTEDTEQTASAVGRNPLVLETGYKARFSGRYRWTAEAGKKAPTLIDPSSSWRSLSASGEESELFTSGVTGVNATYRVRTGAAKTGLMVSGQDVRPAEGNDYKEASVSVVFKYMMFTGLVTQKGLTAERLLALDGELVSSRSVTKSGVTAGASEYYVMAYPKVLGNLTKIIQDGATPVLGAFSKREIKVTNDAGYMQTYNVYVSNNPGAFTDATLQFV